MVQCGSHKITICSVWWPAVPSVAWWFRAVDVPWLINANDMMFVTCGSSSSLLQDCDHGRVGVRMG